MTTFDNLLVRQKEIISTIQQIQINFKKDSASRKTADYIAKRLESLDNLWAEFKQNHSELVTSPDQSQDYFYKNIFDDTKSFYHKLRDMLVSYPTPSGSAHIQQETDKDDVMTAMFNEQKTNFRALRRVINSIDIAAITEKWELEDELRNLQTRWNNIDTLHWKIDNILQGKDMTYDEEYTENEILFKTIKRTIHNKISSRMHLFESTPQLDIPVFFGDYMLWPSFMDLYKSSIHDNVTLTKAQKMQHLKSKLKGEAQRLIQHLHISSDNYDTAWEILCHRYHNHQVLFTKHIEIFLNQPTVQKQTSCELKKLHDTTMEAIHAIHNLGIDTSTWDPLLVHLLVKKLDPITRCDYKEVRKAPRELPTLNEFIQFLETKFTALEPLSKRDKDDTVTLPKQPAVNRIQHRPMFGRTSYNNYNNLVRCVICNNSSHAIFQCRKFEAMTADMKIKTLTDNRICKNCLYVHERQICNSNNRCKVCGECHNTLLHSAIAQPLQQQAKPKSSNHVTNGDEEILLPTVLIKVRTNNNTYITLRALLDQGSQVTLITENAAQRLGLPRHYLNASISGVGSSSKKGKGKIELHCQSIHDDFCFNTEAVVMSKLINKLPTISIQRNNYSHLQHIQLADTEFHISQPIDILLDADVYSKIILNGLIKGSERQPIAQQTKLGWIVSGTIKTLNCNVVINNIQDIAQYWEMEEIPSESTSLTQQEQFCEELFTTTTKRLSNGQNQVRLPMKENFDKQLGYSKARATAQVMQLEKRLTKDDKLYDSYKNFMDEYLTLGHMKECTTNQQPMCYLPHHAVHKEDSTTTKMRTVFNASSPTTTGYSLNDLMECGPKLQQDIQLLLLRWRTKQFVYTADCEKMYRCILIADDQQHLQKILWRQHPQDFLKEYQLCTITYSMKAAPYLAMRTMKQLAMDDAWKYPLAAEVLTKDFYVDDLLSGSNSIEEAKIIQTQLIQMLKGAGFNLRKWTSNSPELLTDLSTQQINPSVTDLQLSDYTKALGLHWNPTTDTFTFSHKDTCNQTSRINKRQLLSEISSLYDPLGWLAPITIKAKLLFQRVWLENKSWDDEVSTDIQEQWVQIRENLRNIDKIKISRWLGDEQSHPELHGFSDASERSYACIIYLKTINDNGMPLIRIVAAKTKLAPWAKTLTLPRLELCGAVLLSKLMNKIIDIMPNGKCIPMYGWTDSLVVLGWLQGEPSRWKVFVANRTKEIIATIASSCWRHVSSAENAADCATRGLTTSQLLQHKLWWEGPACIKNVISENVEKIDMPQIEMKSAHLICTNKQSSMARAVRIICYMTRFVKILLNKINKGSVHTDVDIPVYDNYLTCKEIEDAYLLAIKMTQPLEFQKEIDMLKQKGRVAHQSKIFKLNPYLYDKSILRVGGRLQYSDLTNDAKHPAIIPKNSRLTELLIQQAHLTTLHGGPSLTLALLRHRYWILGGNKTIKRLLRHCITCFRFKKHNPSQIMANLPKPRVTPSRPFTHTGLDFTGNVELKANKGRGIKTTKGYIAIFVCFATKAVHLELVSDLSSSTFLAALKRMCARRGMPKHMYSDNGTNFVGAARILKKEHAVLQSIIDKELLHVVNELGITWHFNVPAFPSGGGLWEAAVARSKFHLKRVIGEQKLTFEEFMTLLTQVEACLNSRPLYALTEDPEHEVLTPGHFLIGSSLLSPPVTENNPMNTHTRWQMLEKMQQDFWKRWSNDYLQQLQKRSKWHHPTENLKKDDIVLIKDENLPPAKWALGKVIETHPGLDGYVRAVTLKTKTGEMKRPVLKLARLPLVDKSDDTCKFPATKPDIII